MAESCAHQGYAGFMSGRAFLFSSFAPESAYVLAKRCFSEAIRIRSRNCSEGFFDVIGHANPDIQFNPCH